MISIKKIYITLFLWISLAPLSFALENSFYILRSNSPANMTLSQNSLKSLARNFNSIQVLISQAYQVDERGGVFGYLDPKVIKFVKEHSVKLMVLVTNAGYDAKKTHRFLLDKAAQKRAIQAILAACEQNHYYGVQLDFEAIQLEDKAALTNFYSAATKVLHKEGFKVSFAVVPQINDGPQPTTFLKRKYQNWSGAYDLKTLGQIGDFVTIMAYDQHGQGTGPGPTAGLRWVEATIKYALQYITRDKISLGVPSYSGYWSTDANHSGQVTNNLADVSYQQVKYLLNKHQANLHWNAQDKIYYAIYQHNWLNEYIFAEEARSFKAKLNLAKKYKLRGLSVFNLGNEDAQIWKVLAKQS